LAKTATISTVSGKKGLFSALRIFCRDRYMLGSPRNCRGNTTVRDHCLAGSADAAPTCNAFDTPKILILGEKEAGFYGKKG
jgi:hypothetical protein